MLAVVEIRPQRHWDRLEGVPEREGHGISLPALIEEMERDGWTPVERHDEWEAGSDHYCVVFSPPPKAPRQHDPEVQLALRPRS
ncbi:MAG: hypothetical protein PVF68_10745 [Acidobacteriota bacterium]